MDCPLKEIHAEWKCFVWAPNLHMFVIQCCSASRVCVSGRQKRFEKRWCTALMGAGGGKYSLDTFLRTWNMHTYQSQKIQQGNGLEVTDAV